MQESLPISGRLPAHLKIKHGPVGLLVRFFLLADSAVRDRGVTLSFGSLQDLIEANKANSDTWRPLVPGFCRGFGRRYAEASVCLDRAEQGWGGRRNPGGAHLRLAGDVSEGRSHFAANVLRRS